MIGQIAGTGAQFNDQSVVRNERLQLLQDYVEEADPRRGRGKAIGPAGYKCRIVKFVLCANDAHHLIFSILICTLKVNAGSSPQKALLEHDSWVLSRAGRFLATYTPV